MKTINILAVLLVMTFTLSACNMISPDESVFEKYCDQFPNDEGCLNDSDPTGIIVTESESCLEGYELQDNVCVILNDGSVDVLTCDLGNHEVDGQCVPDQVSVICENDLILSNGSCIDTCDLPITDTNYYPCFRECNDEFPCTHQKLVLAEENSFFDSFVMWIQSTDMNSSTEFELHYVMSGETEVIVSRGGTKLWCAPHVEGCEDLYKAHFFMTNSPGEHNYIFQFWYDEDWYTKVHTVEYDVWNSETNEYDRIDTGILVFYLENILGAE